MTVNTFPNRIAEILDEPTIRYVARSPAQREASRRNGSRSRGPATAAGRARSAMNSLKHGLLARVIAPPHDPRLHDRLFLEIRKQLMSEFAPRSFTDAATIDALASDYVQMVRARSLIETASRPAILSAEEQARWEMLASAKRDMDSFKELAANLDAGGVLHHTGPEADQLARQLARTLGQVEEDLAVDADDAHADEMCDAHDETETRRLSELASLLGPARTEWADPAHLAQLLDGSRRINRADRHRLRALVGYHIDAAQLWIRGQRPLEDRVQGLLDQANHQLLETSERLMLLATYLARIEHSIERKLTRLRDR